VSYNKRAYLEDEPISKTYNSTKVQKLPNTALGSNQNYMLKIDYKRANAKWMMMEVDV